VGLMVDRIRVRCSVCRSAVPVTVLWAVGDICPHCSQPLRSARRSFNRDEDGVRAGAGCKGGVVGGDSAQTLTARAVGGP
jgi:hypothetical protein